MPYPLTCRIAAKPNLRTSSGGVRNSPLGVLKGISNCRSVTDAQSQEGAFSSWRESYPVGDDISLISRVK